MSPRGGREERAECLSSREAELRGRLRPPRGDDVIGREVAADDDDDDDKDDEDDEDDDDDDGEQEEEEDDDDDEEEVGVVEVRLGKAVWRAR